MPVSEASPIARPAVSIKGRMTVWRTLPASKPRGFAIVLHGRNGGAQQPHIAAVTQACLAAGLSAVVPDLPCSAGNESGGEAADFTMSGHVADCRAVVSWTLEASFGPVVLAGHSMGAYAAGRIAATPGERRIVGLLALSPVVSGLGLIRARTDAGRAALDREVPGALREWPTHDLTPDIPRITIPAAVIVGADDTLTPPATARALADALPRCVTYACLKGEHHCPVGPGYPAALSAALVALLAAQ